MYNILGHILLLKNKVLHFISILVLEEAWAAGRSLPKVFIILGIKKGSYCYFREKCKSFNSHLGITYLISVIVKIHIRVSNQRAVH